MEINVKCPGRKRGGRVFFSSIIILALLSICTPLQAQESDSLSDTAAVTTAEASDGPSLSNLSKSLSAQAEEIARIKEKERHDEIMSYIYMGVGFSVVIGIAWFTTSLARKRRKKEDEQKAIRLAHMKHHHKPHHHRR